MLEQTKEAVNYFNSRFSNLTAPVSPPLEIYPGDGYLAIGGDQDWTYWDIRKTAIGGWNIGVGSERNSTTIYGGRVIIGQFTDALKYLFHAIIVERVAGLSSQIFPSSLPSGVRTDFASSILPPSNLSEEEKGKMQEFIASSAQEELTAESDNWSPSVKMARLIRLYSDKENPSLWYLGSYSNTDLSWGFGESVIDFINMMIGRISSINPPRN